MRAFGIQELGPASHIQPIDLPDPEIGEHDLLIEVHATSLNPVDTKIRATGLGGILTNRPIVMGYDVSGVVTAVGDKVQRFKKGDAVFGSPSLIRPGANAEKVAMDWRQAALKPDSLDHEQAAALPLVTLTAWESLHDRARVHRGETVLIHAGAGGVGHIAVQLASIAGCRVITTASRDESKALCREFGADEVIDYKKEDVVERVKALTDAHGCPVVFDTVGGPVMEQSMDCVGVNGRLVGIVHTKTDQVYDKLFRKNATLHLEFMGVPAIYGIRQEHHGEILRTAAELIDAGKLKPHVSQVLPLEKLAEAHEQIETRHNTGKIVLKVK